jgi:hypothetical protein
MPLRHDAWRQQNQPEPDDDTEQDPAGVRVAEQVHPAADDQTDRPDRDRQAARGSDAALSSATPPRCCLACGALVRGSRLAPLAPRGRTSGSGTG